MSLSIRREYCGSPRCNFLFFPYYGVEEWTVYIFMHSGTKIFSISRIHKG
jgi:hypothetical protein